MLYWVIPLVHVVQYHSHRLAVALQGLTLSGSLSQIYVKMSDLTWNFWDAKHMQYHWDTVQCYSNQMNVLYSRLPCFMPKTQIQAFTHLCIRLFEKQDLKILLKNVSEFWSISLRRNHHFSGLEGFECLLFKCFHKQKHIQCQWTRHDATWAMFANIWLWMINKLQHSYK